MGSQQYNFQQRNITPQQPISQQQKVFPQLPISQERNMSQQNAPAEYAQQITQQQNMAPQHLDIQTVGSVSQQLINNLSDSEVELLERLKSWVESVWNIDNGNIKAKIKRLIQAYSSKLFMEICKESKQSIDLRGIENTQFEHAFNVLTTISNQRKQLTDVQISNKLIGNSPPLTVTLEENLFPGYKIELANAALAFNVLTTISNQRKQLTDVQISNKLIGNSPPLTVTLEENLFPGYKIELANAALAAFQFFLATVKM